MELEYLVSYLDRYLGVPDHPDYPQALNGLQVAGPDQVRSVALAVDASQASIDAAVHAGADVLIVHHGLFWGGAAPVTGARFRRLRSLIEGRLALYACHLPLDSHPEVGNCALLARAIGIEPEHPFGRYQEVHVGWWGSLPEASPVEEFVGVVAKAVGGGSVHLIPGGAQEVRSVAVVTGGGASFHAEAAVLGLDALVTGEGPHHTHADAMEAGVHVLFAGHYATETFGVRAVGAHLAERFDLECTFIDLPSGL